MTTRHVYSVMPALVPASRVDDDCVFGEGCDFPDSRFSVFKLEIFLIFNLASRTGLEDTTTAFLITLTDVLPTAKIYKYMQNMFVLHIYHPSFTVNVTPESCGRHDEH